MKSSAILTGVAAAFISRLPLSILRPLSLPQLAKWCCRMEEATSPSRASLRPKDTHAVPPEFIQKAHWRYNQVKRAELDSDLEIIDFGRGLNEQQKSVLKVVGALPSWGIQEACTAYRRALLGDEYTTEDAQTIQNVPIYEHSEFPGLQILPALLPPDVQILYTSQIMHRDLADPKHKNNLMADYDIPYPGLRDVPANNTAQANHKSFFTYPQHSFQDASLTPKDPSEYKAINMAQFLASKLRWLTIGEQYHWPTRSYGINSSPFPTDLSTLVQGIFPHIRPESGVILVYSGKDYMPVHRDVSEQCESALASFSLGCDGIFIIARGEDNGEENNRPRTAAIRVRSGDCIHLDGEARWAWHAMARTITGTCPDYLASWPACTIGATREEKKMYNKWKGYMNGKRLNISCRQVFD